MGIIGYFNPTCQLHDGGKFNFYVIRGEADKTYAPESPGWLSRREIAATKSSRTSASAAKRDQSLTALREGRGMILAEAQERNTQQYRRASSAAKAQSRHLEIPCRMQKTHRARRPRGRQLLSAAPTAILQPLRSCVPPFFCRTASPVRALWQCTFCKNVLRRQLHFRQQRLESDCQAQCTADSEKSIDSYADRPHFKPLKRALGYACTLCQLCLR